MKKNSRIFLIGGGTGGHIFPLRNLTDELQKQNLAVELILADAKLDRLIAKENFKNVPTHFFRTEKIRRYFDLRNLIAPFLILWSVVTASRFLQKHRPRALFFKGGFVGFPFLIAATWLNLWRKKSNKIWLFSHESDLSSGALTRLARRLADEVFESFGTPPLPLFYEGSQKPNKKSAEILIFGGSQGAQYLNELFSKYATEILAKFRVTLVTGLGKPIDLAHKNLSQVELMPAAELSQYIKACDLVISRAGANSLFEIISAKKPSIIVPYPEAARNHQQKNADFFAQQNLCVLYPQGSRDNLMSIINDTLANKKLHTALKKSTIENSAKKISQKISQSIC